MPDLISGSYKPDDNYDTPAQTKAQMDYAHQLLYGKGQQPVKHWTQGVSNMVAALMGGKDMYDAGHKDRASDLLDAGTAKDSVMPQLGSGPPEGQPPQNPTEGAEHPPQVESQEAAVPSAAALQAALESPTPETSLPPTNTPGSNVQNQEIATNIRNKNLNSVSPEADAVKMALMKTDLSDPSHPLTGGMPMQFAQALSKTPGKVMQPNTPPPLPQRGQEPVLDPSLLPGRTNAPNARQMQLILASRRLSPEVKNLLFMKFIEDQQGGAKRTPYGSGEIIYNPNNPSVQRYNPKFEGKELKGPGGSAIPYTQTTVPDGRGGWMIRRIPIEGAQGAPSGYVPPPSGGPAGPQDAGPSNFQLGVQGPPEASEGGPEGAFQQAITGGPPRARVAAPAPVPAPEPAAQTQPIPGLQPKPVKTERIGPPPIVPPVAPPAAPPVSGGPPTGQVGVGAGEPPPPPGRPPFIAPEDAASLEYLNSLDAKRQGQVEMTKKDADDYAKKTTAISEGADSASQMQTNLKLLRQYVNDPRFISGFAAKQREEFANAMNTFGVPGWNPKVNQAFEKLRSEGVLMNMKAKLGGLGQIRLAEISLLDKAFASSNNTVGANKVIIELASRSADRMVKAEEIAQHYNEGYRWGNDGKLIRNAQGQPVISRDRSASGLQATLANYRKHNPMLSDKEIEEYDALFDDSQPVAKGSGNKGLKVGPQAAPPPGFR